MRGTHQKEATDAVRQVKREEEKKKPYNYMKARQRDGRRDREQELPHTYWSLSQLDREYKREINQIQYRIIFLVVSSIKGDPQL